MGHATKLFFDIWRLYFGQTKSASFPFSIRACVVLRGYVLQARSIYSRDLCDTRVSKVLDPDWWPSREFPLTLMMIGLVLTFTDRTNRRMKLGQVISPSIGLLGLASFLDRPFGPGSPNGFPIRRSWRIHIGGSPPHAWFCLGIMHHWESWGTWPCLNFCYCLV